jgi:hypothetical protein
VNCRLNLNVPFPSKEHQFKPGQSGNPKGAQTREQIWERAVLKALKRYRPAKIDGQAVKLKSPDWLAELMFNLAQKGNAKAIDVLIPQTQKHEISGPDGSAIGPLLIELVDTRDTPTVSDDGKDPTTK